MKRVHQQFFSTREGPMRLVCPPLSAWLAQSAVDDGLVLIDGELRTPEWVQAAAAQQFAKWDGNGKKGGATAKANFGDTIGATSAPMRIHTPRPMRPRRRSRISRQVTGNVPNMGSQQQFRSVCSDTRMGAVLFNVYSQQCQKGRKER